MASERVTTEDLRAVRVNARLVCAVEDLEMALLDMLVAESGAVQVRASALALRQLLDHRVVGSSQADETADETDTKE